MNYALGIFPNVLGRDSMELSDERHCHSLADPPEALHHCTPRNWVVRANASCWHDCGMCVEVSEPLEHMRHMRHTLAPCTRGQRILEGGSGLLKCLPSTAWPSPCWPTSSRCLLQRCLSPLFEASARPSSSSACEWLRQSWFLSTTLPLHGIGWRNRVGSPGGIDCVQPSSLKDPQQHLA